MKHIKPLIYDFYARIIIKRVKYCNNKKEVINFYKENLFQEIIEEKKIDVDELKKRFIGSKDYRLETLVEELNKTKN